MTANRRIRALQFSVVAAVAVSVHPVAVRAESPSYAAEGRNISFFNTPNRDGTFLKGTEPTPVASVSISLQDPADVLVQFTSEIAADKSEGCPCSVRASLEVNDGEPLVIKRINVGTPAAQQIDKYEHDRQNIDGSYVFSLPAGKHVIALVYHQVDGTSKLLEVFYPNLQAIAFPKR